MYWQPYTFFKSSVRWGSRTVFYEFPAISFKKDRIYLFFCWLPTHASKWLNEIITGLISGLLQPLWALRKDWLNLTVPRRCAWGINGGGQRLARNHPLQKLPTEHFQGKRENGKVSQVPLFSTPTPTALTRDGVIISKLLWDEQNSNLWVFVKLFMQLW